MAVIDDLISALPAGMPGWQRSVRIDHIYARVALLACQSIGARSLGEVIADPAPRDGLVVCSTEVLEGTPDVYDRKRIEVWWVPEFQADRRAVLELSTRHISADTTKWQLSKRSRHSLIAQLVRVEDEVLAFAPLILGAPWLDPPPEGVSFVTMHLHYNFFEHFVEDIDEFSGVADVPFDVDWSLMGSISERAFKLCLCEVLRDKPTLDWGGERSDHFTSHVHIQGQRLTAAFLLKGPGSGFAAMQPAHLGKNADQIVRLASEPAGLLVVQHCHEIGTAVRAMLRAFAVRPHEARRYCLIDGRDSFRLLAAYGLLDKALALSKKES